MTIKRRAVGWCHRVLDKVGLMANLTDPIPIATVRRLGAISSFDNEAEANAFATSALLALKQSIDVRVIRDPDSGQYIVTQSIAYLERPGDHTYAL